MSPDKAKTISLTEEELMLSIVHDVRRHLRTSVVRTQLLERELPGPIPPNIRHHLDQILAAGRDMNALLGRLALYAAASSIRDELPPSDISLLFDSALQHVAHRNKDAEIISKVIESSAVAAPFSIETVLRELLDNALKFRHGPVKITILIERKAGEHVVGIQDTGIGFDPKYGERIFLPLERLHPYELYGGCGMGLAICQRTLQTLGGRIWSDSKLNIGSTFWFSFPA